MSEEIKAALLAICAKLEKGSEADRNVGAIINITLAMDNWGLAEGLAKLIYPWAESVTSIALRHSSPPLGLGREDAT